ncbi:MAG: helix-turn-helix domain-containing protein [Rhodobiaceae bacterium]|nr:helix-turn-helix domain-containing protein [Rhodobiaceae bacterium]MCC0055432.1 helix-turn-helix domain-containing protein [Rhodobiaceae bacterium]
MTPFGARIREMRQQRGITLQDMAAALEVSPAYLSALEHGKRGRPNWFFLQRIISYFNVIWDEAEALQRLALISHPRVVVDTAGLSPDATELANRLAEEIGGLNDAEIAELLSQLKAMSRGRRQRRADPTE